MPLLLNRSTARRLMQKLAEAEGSNLDRDGFCPRDLGGDSTPTPMSFRCSKIGAEITISDGSIRTSTANYAVASATVTLTGGPSEWVYLWHERDHSASGFSHSATDPVSSGSRWIWPLAKYNVSAGVYSLDRVLHVGDVFLYLAMS